MLDRASAAIARHIDAVGRLQIANIMQRHELIPDLEESVGQSRDQREQAVAEYKRHEISHRARSASGGFCG